MVGFINLDDYTVEEVTNLPDSPDAAKVYYRRGDRTYFRPVWRIDPAGIGTDLAWEPLREQNHAIIDSARPKLIGHYNGSSDHDADTLYPTGLTLPDRAVFFLIALNQGLTSVAHIVSVSWLNNLTAVSGTSASADETGSDRNVIKLPYGEGAGVLFGRSTTDELYVGFTADHDGCYMTVYEL